MYLYDMFPMLYYSSISHWFEYPVKKKKQQHIHPHCIYPRYINLCVLNSVGYIHGYSVGWSSGRKRFTCVLSTHIYWLTSFWFQLTRPSIYSGEITFQTACFRCIKGIQNTSTIIVYITIPHIYTIDIITVTIINDQNMR